MVQKFTPNLFLSKIKINILLIIYLFSAIIAYSQEEIADEDKTLSPFFFVKSEDQTVDQLPLKSTSANVIISGIIADVTVKQTYCNVGNIPLEAIYIFPASTKAAVYYMQMALGNRILIAEIKEREQARQEYEQAKEEGKTATLLEQQRPNVFQMNVANILPGDTIEVEMRYTELITSVEGVYEFVYPTVVGPRYASPVNEGENEEWVEIPYQHEGEAPTYSFNINILINPGMPIKEIQCPSHETLQYLFGNMHTVKCWLPDSSSSQGNKDFILQYVLAGNELESGMLLYEGEDENFFLAMIQPPKKPQNYQIPPREYVFIMDVSGSMYGYPINISKTLLIDLITELNVDDKFNVQFFAGGSALLSDKSLIANEENIQLAVDMIDNQTGGGGTELLPALEKALALEGTENYSRTFVIATDGYVSVEKEAFDLIRNNLSNANFFPFGIGTGVNRYIIEGMAHVGMGEPLIITKSEEAEEKADKFRKYIQYPVLTNIQVDYEGFDVYDVEPLTIPDVFAERPVLIFGKWRGNPVGTIRVTGLSGNSNFDETLDVSDYVPTISNMALKYLWARYRIQLLDDYGQVIYDVEELNLIKEEIIQLGLKYSLLTRYTSFVAIDSIIRNESDTVTTVTQPVPLPEGVSDYAVGDWDGTGYSRAATNEAAYVTNKNEIVTQSGSFINYNYPNPFFSMTNISIYISDLDIEKDKKLKIFNYSGQLVKEVDLNINFEGMHEIEIILANDGSELPAGIYYVTLIIDNKISNSIKIYKTAIK